MNNIDKLVAWISTLPTPGRVLTYIALIAIIAAIIFFSSCSSTRSMSVSVDKAENVDIHLKDSLGTAIPFY